MAWVLGLKIFISNFRLYLVATRDGTTCRYRAVMCTASEFILAIRARKTPVSHLVKLNYIPYSGEKRFLTSCRNILFLGNVKISIKASDLTKCRYKTKKYKSRFCHFPSDGWIYEFWQHFFLIYIFSKSIWKSMKPLFSGVECLLFFPKQARGSARDTTK